GAVGRIPAFGIGALLMASAGLFAICLLRTRLRFAGIGLVLAAIAMAIAVPRPDVLVSANADAVAVRGIDGRLSILRNSSDPLAVREWLGADGDGRDPKDAGLKDGFLCDQMGCIAHLPDGTMVSGARTGQAGVEDCDQVSLMVTTRRAPRDCRALVVDRETLHDGGAMTLQRSGKGWEIVRAVPAGAERPWAHAQQRAGAQRTSSTDATPRADDL